MVVHLVNIFAGCVRLPEFHNHARDWRAVLIGDASRDRDELSQGARAILTATAKIESAHVPFTREFDRAGSFRERQGTREERRVRHAAWN